MAKPKNERPDTRPKAKETLRSIYARIRKEFGAGDLQKYTKDEEGVPADRLLTELEAIDRAARPRREPS